MIKKAYPILFIFFIWFLFSKPLFIGNKIPFPADLQVNSFSLWSTYSSYWSPVKNPDQPDVISQILPWKKLTIDSIKNKEIPFWNPYSFSGSPHLANYQSGTFSITNIFYFIFNFETAWGLAVTIQPLLAGIFIYLFLRSLEKSKLASLFSSVSFMFCSFITTWMSYSTLSLAISFLPLCLFAIEKYFNSSKDRYLLLLSTAILLSFFSGHFQTSIYLFFFIILYIAFKFIDTKNKFLTINSFIFSFFGILLALPQILPSIEFYNQSVRSNIYQKIEAVPLKHLITIFSPDYFGNPVTRNVSFARYAEWGSFFGTIPFFLSIFAILHKNKYILFFAFTGILSIIVSLNSPALDLIVGLKIPVISTSAAGRALVIFSFSFSVLAGFGIDLLINELKQKKTRKIITWLGIIIFLIAFVWAITLGRLAGPIDYIVSIKNLIIPNFLFLTIFVVIIIGLLIKRSIYLLIIVLLILTSFDVLRFSTKWQTFSDKNLAFQTTPIISKLQKLDENYRVHGPFGAEGSVYYKIPGTEGYDPLYIDRYGKLIGSLNDGKVKSSPRQGLTFPTSAKYSPKIFDLLGIRYVLQKKSDEGKIWDFPFKKYPNKLKLIYKDKLFSIYENKNAFPKAFLVGDAVVETNNQKIIDKILKKDFNLRKSVVLEKDPKINETQNLIGEASVIKYSPNRVLIKTNSKNNSILVLNDNYYPGWNAKINGEEKEILRADFTFRAVEVPRGQNTVEFYFESKTFKTGVYLAIIGFLSIAFIIIGRWYNNKKWTHKSKTAKSATKSFVKTANGKQIKKKRKKS